jgi:hypothetical protein
MTPGVWKPIQRLIFARISVIIDNPEPGQERIITPGVIKGCRKAKLDRCKFPEKATEAGSIEFEM